MIISEKYRFVFIHIPKNAGTTVRLSLGAISENPELFADKVNHLELGAIHLAHVTLEDLATYYPETFTKLQNYKCCALVRDPEERFMSSIFQRLREYQGIDQSMMTDACVKAEIQSVTRFLATAARRLPLEYVHFMPQNAYVDYAGKRIVNNLYLMSDFADAAAFIRRTTGVAIDAGDRRNSSAALRYRTLRPVVRLLKTPYNFLPISRRERIRVGLIRRGILANQTTSSLAMLDEVRPFLTEYYAADYALYREIAENNRRSASCLSSEAA